MFCFVVVALKLLWCPWSWKEQKCLICVYDPSRATRFPKGVVHLIGPFLSPKGKEKWEKWLEWGPSPQFSTLLSLYQKQTSKWTNKQIWVTFELSRLDRNQIDSTFMKSSPDTFSFLIRNFYWIKERNASIVYSTHDLDAKWNFKNRQKTFVYLSIHSLYKLLDWGIQIFEH